MAMNTVTNPDGPDDTWVRLIGKTWYWFALVLQEEDYVSGKFIKTIMAFKKTMWKRPKNVIMNMMNHT